MVDDSSVPNISSSTVEANKHPENILPAELSSYHFDDVLMDLSNEERR